MNDSSRQPVRRASGLAQAVARYYAEFLSTDFKSARLPKRVSERKNAKGMLVGADLSRYPALARRIHKALCGPAYELLSVEIKRGSYRSELPALVHSVVEGAIEQIDQDQLDTLVHKLIERSSRLVTGGDMDVEIFRDVVMERITEIISRELIEPMMGNLREHLKNAANRPEEDIISLQRGLAERLVGDLPEKAIDGLSDLILHDETASLGGMLASHLEAASVKHVMRDYFESYIASDLHTELIDMRMAQRMLENTELFLYIGTVQLNGVTYPLSFQRLELTESVDSFRIEADSRLHINKQAIDFVVAELCEKAGREMPPSVLGERIIDLMESDASIMEILQGVVDQLGLAAAIKIESHMAEAPGQTLTQADNVSISSRTSVALADKSDESMLNDYEALLTGMGCDASSVEAFEALVDNFLTQNPESVHHRVEDYWQSLSLGERLVFDSPLPLAEEQRKILVALDMPETKYVAVEGPPGTGKSHTITAIAFDAILRGKSLLILSDKVEALDVVEDKINGVLRKVRHKEKFQNPILRLGRYSGNYNRLLRRSTIESIETSRRLSKSSVQDIKGLREIESEELKSDIEGAAYALSEISLKAISDAIALEQEVLDQLPHLKELPASQTCDVVRDFLTCAKYFEDSGTHLKALLRGPDGTSVRHLRKIRKATDLVEQSGIGAGADLSLIRTMNARQIDALRDIVRDLDAAKGVLGFLLSGRVAKGISDRAYEEFGINLGRPQQHRKTLETILAVAERALSEIRDRGMTEDDFPLVYDLMRNGTPPIIPVEVLAGAERLEIAISEKHPLLEGCSEEKLLHALLDESDPTLKNLRLFASAQAKLEDVRQQFSSVPQIDYLGSKSRLEEMYTHELAGVIDDRLLSFYHHRRADAETLGDIIRARGRFPPERFKLLQEAFPCIISGLRDYAEYIPLQKGMFDLVIIDEASQVSIAQAMPAIVRAKKMVVLGDRKQFGNVKTALASKAINNAYMHEMLKSLSGARKGDKYTMKRLERFNIKSSLMDFFDLVANYNIQLRKHFRSYPELIGFSSENFYDGSLQTMKVRSKPLHETIVFHPVQTDGEDPGKNSNEKEAAHIFAEIEDMLDDQIPYSVGIITPHTDQVALLHRMLDAHPRKKEMVDLQKVKVMNFDSCQGEERDVVFYSMVASQERDRLSHVFPATIATAADDIEYNLRLQRLNVGFSRAREKIVIVHSKPIEDFRSSVRTVLLHFKSIADKAGEIDRSTAQSRSEQETMVHEWLVQTPTIQAMAEEVQIQFGFAVNTYLESLDPAYKHPAYRVDILLSLSIGDQQRYIVIEYDDFEGAFGRTGKHGSKPPRGTYLSRQDIERERILESFGLKILRINRFVLGADPVSQLDQMLDHLINEMQIGEVDCAHTR